MSAEPNEPALATRARKTLLLINGPNLNLLGHREPHIYGTTTLADIEAHLTGLARRHDIHLLTFQSNHEGAIVDRIHEAFYANQLAKSEARVGAGVGVGATEGEGATTVDGSSSGGGEGQLAKVPGTVNGIIINPGAYTHTSVAIRDALSGVSIPFVECHISNVHAREEFRHKSFLSDKAEAVIAGLGVFGYVAAVEWWSWRWKGGKLQDAGN